MDKLKLVSLKRVDGDFIETQWKDGLTARVSLKSLRDNCPCAVCKDQREKNSGNPNVIFLGKYTLKEIVPCGTYALNFIWADRHDSGIYDWDTLREIFEQHKI